MATSRNVYNLDTLKTVGFEFNIQRIPNTIFTIQEVNLPGVTLGEVNASYATGKTPFAGDTLLYNELNISFLIDETMNNWREIYNWQRGLAPTRLDTAENQYLPLKQSREGIVSDGTLIIMTNEGNPNITVSFKDLFPVSLSDVQFKTTETSIEVIPATVSFRFTSYDIEINKALNNKFVPGNII